MRIDLVNGTDVWIISKNGLEYLFAVIYNIERQQPELNYFNPRTELEGGSTFRVTHYNIFLLIEQGLDMLADLEDEEIEDQGCLKDYERAVFDEAMRILGWA